MRILHVNKFLHRRGGAEGYMFDVAALQRRAGHEVGLWGMSHPDNDRPLPLEDTFAPHVELEPAPTGLAGAAAGARMVWSRSSRRGIEQALVRFRPDIVHLHNVYHQLSPSILAAVRRAGVPCVMTLHDYKLVCPSYQLLDHGSLCERCVTGSTWNAARQRCKGGSLAGSALLAVESGIHRRINAYGPVDLFISPSRFLYDVMARGGIDPDRLRVVNHFVELQDAPRAEDHAGGFVFAGRLSHEKGVDTLIEAVALAPEVRLDIAGDGPARAALERLAADRAPGRVHFHGRLPKPELAELVARATASVVPSRWYENQPMTILESFGAAVPVIATNLGGMPELVREGREGLLVPHDDPGSLAGALQHLHRQPELAQRMGRSALARLEVDFSAPTHLAAVSDCYREAAERRGAAAGAVGVGRS